ncbi:MAG: hypothetical protein AAF298_15385 [Cyanobacteria bacterium P01_A01_bin.40]
MMVEESNKVNNSDAKKSENTKKERIKATFSLLDHTVKIFNNTETYIKRSLTLFGLGTVMTGAAFSVGQRLSPSTQPPLPQPASDNAAPEAPLNPSPQINQPPQIIYIQPPNEPQQDLNSQPIPALPQQAPTPVDTTPQTPQVATQPQPKVILPQVTSQPVQEKLSQAKETVYSIEQISYTLNDIQQDIVPFFGNENSEEVDDDD